MRQLGALAAVCALVAVSVVQVHGQCDDPYDNVLCASRLSDEAAGQFSSTDNLVSPFWDTVSIDYVELVPPDDCGPAGNCNFTGQDDASLSLKAAATSFGVYVYAGVTDNTWVDPAGGDSYGDDSVDLYFDSMDANAIFTCTNCLIGLYSSTLTYSTNQVQVFMGASSTPSTFRFAHYDQNLWSWQTETLTWESARTLYGFEAEIIEVNGTTKVQEWFFPWHAFGNSSIEPGADLSDTKVGFTGGYNDMDGDNTQPDKLRWPEAGDPWAGDAQEFNYWGDIQIPGDVATSIRPDRRVRGGVGVESASRELTVRYFGIDGRTLSADAILNLSPNALVVRRATMADGGTHSRMVRVTR